MNIQIRGIIFIVLESYKNNALKAGNYIFKYAK